MALLGAKDLIDPKDIQAQIKALRDQEKRYKSAKDGFLRGRTINQAETDAKACIQDAEDGAQKIREEVLLLKNQAKDALAEAKSIKAGASDKAAGLSKKESELVKKEASINAQLDKAAALEGNLARKIAKADEKEAEYKSRLNEIDRVLQGLING